MATPGESPTGRLISDAVAYRCAMPRHRGLAIAILALALGVAAAACSSAPTYEPWGESVAVADVLDGAGYTSELALGDSSIRLTATEDRSVLWSVDDDTTLVYVEADDGTAGYRRFGDGPWTAYDQVAPTWPTALLVPSFADLLVAAAAAEEAGDEDGLTRYDDGPLDLSALQLGTDLYVTYWLNDDGRAVRWATGSEPGAETIRWSIRPAVPQDLEGVPSADDVVDASDLTGLVPASEFTGTSIAGETNYAVTFQTESGLGASTVILSTTEDITSIEILGDTGPITFTLRDDTEDPVAVEVSDRWTFGEAAQQQLDAVADSLVVVSPDATHQAMSDVLIDLEPVATELVSGFTTDRYEPDDVPATLATEQFGWTESNLTLWVSQDGLPVQWRVESDLGTAIWTLTQLGGPVAPKAPPEWVDAG